MKRSTNRILTSHAGSLPRPERLLEVNRTKIAGQGFDAKEYAARLTDAVGEIAARQAAVGVDIINDGEYGKASSGAIDYGAWQSYAWGRLSGWEPGEPRPAPALSIRRERQKFKDFYRDLDATQFISSTSSAPRPPVVRGPIRYIGQEAVKTDIANFKKALAATKAEEGFITAVAPGSFGRRQNEYYKSEEEFLYALADALKEEYKAIVDAGFVLQIDDPGLPDNWDMANPEPKLDDYKKFARLRIDAINHALAGLPEDRVRYHICWGSWHGPHTTDVPLAYIIDLLLMVKAGAYSVEAGNVRHEHEWKIWREVKLPPGKILIPGVVSHATNVIEHPELVADRIVRFAQVVGRENVIAATDCGLGGRIHADLVWAKLEVLVEGAKLATKQLWG
ncbi:MAG TPA: cobalamin-independent methionine synthase II family protein [Stellaceae bacterium]|nr:cobalamin-independent methionine synthase II family protein [Stellaceae bacterium]